MSNQGLAEAAAILAREGYPVFPCDKLKRPCTKHGFLDATDDPGKARRMFLNCRNAALISMVTGAKTGIIVVDIDPQGLRWFRGRITKFRETRIDETPRKGLHLFYRYSGTDIRNSAGKLARGIDIRGDGGSCIVAPSPGYTTIHDVEIAALPNWIHRRLTKKPKQDDRNMTGGSGNIAALEKFVSAAPEGERNSRLFWSANRLREAIAQGKANVADQSALLSAAIQAGLPHPEARATIRSGMGYYYNGAHAR